MSAGRHRAHAVRTSTGGRYAITVRVCAHTRETRQPGGDHDAVCFIRQDAPTCPLCTRVYRAPVMDVTPELQHRNKTH